MKIHILEHFLPMIEIISTKFNCALVLGLDFLSNLDMTFLNYTYYQVEIFRDVFFYISSNVLKKFDTF